jgi:hypothetical protein
MKADVVDFAWQVVQFCTIALAVNDAKVSRVITFKNRQVTLFAFHAYIVFEVSVTIFNFDSVDVVVIGEEKRFWGNVLRVTQKSVSVNVEFFSRG